MGFWVPLHLLPGPQHQRQLMQDALGSPVVVTHTRAGLPGCEITPLHWDQGHLAAQSPPGMCVLQ